MNLCLSKISTTPENASGSYTCFSNSKALPALSVAVMGCALAAIAILAIIVLGIATVMATGSLPSFNVTNLVGEVVGRAVAGVSYLAFVISSIALGMICNAKSKKSPITSFTESPACTELIPNPEKYGPWSKVFSFLSTNDLKVQMQVSKNFRMAVISSFGYYQPKSMSYDRIVFLFKNLVLSDPVRFGLTSKLPSIYPFTESSTKELLKAHWDKHPIESIQEIFDRAKNEHPSNWDRVELLLYDPRVDPMSSDSAIIAASVDGRTKVLQLILRHPRFDSKASSLFSIAAAKAKLKGDTDVVKLLQKAIKSLRTKEDLRNYRLKYIDDGPGATSHGVLMRRLFPCCV